MEASDKFMWALNDIGDAILAEKEKERKLYAGYKALNPAIPNDYRDHIHTGIMEGLDRAFQIFLDAHRKNGIGG